MLYFVTLLQKLLDVGNDAALLGEGGYRKLKRLQLPLGDVSQSNSAVRLCDHLIENCVYCENEIPHIHQGFVYDDLEDMLVYYRRPSFPDETSKRGSRGAGPRKQDVSCVDQ